MDDSELESAKIEKSGIGIQKLVSQPLQLKIFKADGHVGP